MDLICRTCLNLTSTRDTDLKEEAELITKIELLVGIQINIENKYPSIICARCVEKVDDFIKFRQLVIESDSRIRHYSSNFNIKDVEVEFDDSDSDLKTIKSYRNLKLSVEPNEGVSSPKECLDKTKKLKIKNDIFQEHSISKSDLDEITSDLLPESFNQVDEDSIENDIKFDHADLIYNSDLAAITSDPLQNPCSQVDEECIENYIKSEDDCNGTRTQPEKLEESGSDETKFKVDHESNMNQILDSNDISQENIQKNITSSNIEMEAMNELRTTCRKKYQCQECGEIFSQRKECSSHRYKVHLRKVCSICGLTMRADHFPKHMKIHQDNPIACKICNKVLKNRLSLRTHTNLHKGLKYECEICKHVFKIKYEYERHVKRHKDPNKPRYGCETCGKKVFDLRKHMFTHTGLKPHICKFCEKGFTSSNALKIHQRQHTNERPYVCEYCSKGFPQKVLLKYHLKSKHGKKD